MQRALRRYKQVFYQKDKKELWKICDSEDPKFNFPRYMVSNFGRVRTVPKGFHIAVHESFGNPTVKMYETDVGIN
jgi:hypothetical protein